MIMARDARSVSLKQSRLLYITCGRIYAVTMIEKETRRATCFGALAALCNWDTSGRRRKSSCPWLRSRYRRCGRRPELRLADRRPAKRDCKNESTDGNQSRSKWRKTFAPQNPGLPKTMLPRISRMDGRPGTIAHQVIRRLRN